MVRLTLIARVSDGLPLAEGLDSDKDGEIDQYKTQAKVSDDLMIQFSFDRTTVGLRSGDHCMWLHACTHQPQLLTKKHATRQRFVDTNGVGSIDQPVRVHKTRTCTYSFHIVYLTHLVVSVM